MSSPPRNIRVLKEQGVLELDWDAGTPCRLPLKLVRFQCPCASCVDEITGVRVVDIASIPDDIRPTEVAFSGNYALRFTWSDGHNTGLYTWSYLQELCASAPRAAGEGG